MTETYSILGLLFACLLLLISMVAFYANVWKPFYEARRYIKTEISRCGERERSYWKRELKKLYWGRIPILKRFL